jgi:hypothetical protein
MRLPAAVFTGLFVALVAPVHPAAAQASDDPIGFKTPSGRIHCDTYPDDGATGKPVLRCDITGPNQPRVARPKDCELDYGYAFELTEPGGKARLLCAGDTTANPEHKVLAYGSTWESQGFRCDVTPLRLRCVNKSAHGFELSARHQRRF